MPVPFNLDFDGDLEVNILVARLYDLKKALIMSKEATPDENPLEWRMKALHGLQEIQNKIDLLSHKLKAGLPEQPRKHSTSVQFEIEKYFEFTGIKPINVDSTKLFDWMNEHQIIIAREDFREQWQTMTICVDCGHCIGYIVGCDNCNPM